MTASLSSSVMPSTGAGSKADPPPERRQRHKSSGASDGNDSQNLLRARRAFRRRFIHARRPSGMEMNVL